MYGWKVLKNQFLLTKPSGRISTTYLTNVSCRFATASNGGPNSEEIRIGKFSTIDTNETTFAIKDNNRVFREREFRYSWPMDKENIHMRYQNLHREEVNRLYEKLKLRSFSRTA